MINNFFVRGVNVPIRVGLVGTGYVAQHRAQALQADPRSLLLAVAGHDLAHTQVFAQTYQLEMDHPWLDLVTRTDLDLIIICSASYEHGAIARAALAAGKHIVVEYPLALDVVEAQELITLATQSQLLLHVAHIELLGGLHQALKQSLPTIGSAFFARYVTISPQRPAPQKWSYQRELFGFPLIGALSRLHRLIDLFGQVTSVNCVERYWDVPETDFYRACWCHAQLGFTNGVIGEVVYGKGETFWQKEQTFIVYGDGGNLIFTPETGKLIREEQERSIAVASRQGLFAKETKMILDYLTAGTPLYITPGESLYTLKIADAARRSAQIGEMIRMEE